MESFPLPPRTVGMVSGWSELSSGIHASEDCYEQRMLCPSVALPARLFTHTLAVQLLESLCVTVGDRGRCRRDGNVRDDTHTHSSRREITTHSSHVDLQHRFCLVRSLDVTVVQSC